MDEGKIAAEVGAVVDEVTTGVEAGASSEAADVASTAVAEGVRVDAAANLEVAAGLVKNPVQGATLATAGTSRATVLDPPTKAMQAAAAFPLESAEATMVANGGHTGAATEEGTAVAIEAGASAARTEAAIEADVVVNVEGIAGAVVISRADSEGEEVAVGE